MASSAEVISKAPVSRELSLIPGSREISAASLDHAQNTSPIQALRPQRDPPLAGFGRDSPLGVPRSHDIQRDQPIGSFGRDPPLGGFERDPPLGVPRSHDVQQDLPLGGRNVSGSHDAPGDPSPEGVDVFTQDVSDDPAGDFGGIAIAESHDAHRDPPIRNIGGLTVTGSRDAVTYMGRRQREPQLVGQGQADVITTQPGMVNGTGKSPTIMSVGSSVLDPLFDREMAPLRLHDVIRIQQQIDIDIKGGCGSGNTYNVVGEDGTTIFTVAEDSNCFCRWVCGPARMSHMTFYDLDEQPVLHLDRACCRCDCCCCFNCCLCQHKMVVRDARGRIVGQVKERFHILQLRLELEDHEGQRVLQITGPCCPLRCCSEMTFDIISATGTKEVGYILKKWREDVPLGGNNVNFDHENIELTMPPHCTAEEQALVLGAAMLANLMYMELS